MRFVGGTLWFLYPREPRERFGLADYHQIKGFEPWVYNECTRTRRFLREHVVAGDVVVTHHLPSPRSVADKYKGSPLNEFFVCDVESVIRDAQPKLWIHGHTHESCDYRIGDTRVVCNPHGYIGHEVNPRFDRSLTVEV